MIYLYQDTERRNKKITDNKSRAEYFKKRRKLTRSFYAEIETEKMDIFEDILNAQKKTKKEWLIEKIDNEIEINRQ